MVDGWVVGGWRRTVGKDRVVVEVHSLLPLDGPATDSLGRAVERYGSFLGLPAAPVVR